MCARLLYLTFFLLILVSIQPANATARIRMIPETGIRLAITPAYDVAPVSGFLPVYITISNISGRARTWLFKAKHHGYTGAGSTVFTQPLPVPDQSEQTFEVYVPVLFSDQSYKNIQMQVTGYGIRTATLDRYASPLHNALPYIAMSEALHLRSWPVLTQALEKKRVYLYGSKAIPGNLPRQWRGYAGIWRLIMTAEEWDGLLAEVRSAVIDWIMMGGQLHLFHRDRLPQGSRDYGGFRFTGLTGTDSAKEQLGLGHVALQVWNGKEIDLSYLDVLQNDAKQSTQPALYEHSANDYTRKAWPFLNNMPKERFSKVFLWVLGAFLCFYFILAGPYNMWRLAKSGKRLQLFFSTPLLAIACSVILCVMMAMHAGFGAWGFRTTGVYILPNQPKAIVMQEQITKTAFMLQTAFNLPLALFMSPIPLTKVPGKADPKYQLTAGHLTGDWFANNAVQAQFTTALKPTRAGVALVPGAAPGQLTLRSSINAVLREIYVRDANDQYWHGRDVAGGREAVLRPVSPRDYQKWRRNTIHTQTSPKLQRALHRIDSRPGVFAAVAERAPDFAVDTLPGIDWKSQTVVIFGHLPSANATAGNGDLILHAAGRTP